MALEIDDSAAAESIESWFFHSTVKVNNCSLEPKSGAETCPSYYKILSTAVDWHIITAIFAVMIVFTFVGMAVGKK